MVRRRESNGKRKPAGRRSIFTQVRHAYEECRCTACDLARQSSAVMRKIVWPSYPSGYPPKFYEWVPDATVDEDLYGPIHGYEDELEPGAEF